MAWAGRPSPHARRVRSSSADFCRGLHVLDGKTGAKKLGFAKNLKVTTPPGSELMARSLSARWMAKLLPIKLITKAPPKARGQCLGKTPNIPATRQSDGRDEFHLVPILKHRFHGFTQIIFIRENPCLQLTCLLLRHTRRLPDEIAVAEFTVFRTNHLWFNGGGVSKTASRVAAKPQGAVAHHPVEDFRARCPSGGGARGEADFHLGDGRASAGVHVKQRRDRP
jgi:hypothetical protein